MIDITPLRYLTTADAARYLAIGRQTLPKLRLRGSGPPFLKFGRTVRYSIEDLDEWARTRRRRSTSDRGNSVRRRSRSS
jgi:excisionase family DNA binding protein